MKLCFFLDSRNEMDYKYFQREVIAPSDFGAMRWDAVVIAYNSSTRVIALWEAAESAFRVWANHAEYCFDAQDLPDGGIVVNSSGKNESEFAELIIAAIINGTGRQLPDLRLAVDLTGFMRPELVCLVQKLKLAGATIVDFLYAEPMRYRQKGWTKFSRGNVREVRQVMICEGIHDLDTDADVLLIGTGYDDLLMKAVAEHKPHSNKLLLFGFPSLALDMYQENVWRVSHAEEALGSSVAARQDHLFAPANDPFVTAEVVSRAVRRAVESDGAKNIYLSPLGTKVQVFGFALYFAVECLDKNRPISILLPFADGYEQKTSEGVSRTWRYIVDLRA